MFKISSKQLNKRNKRAHGKRKNRNLKRKNRHTLTLSDLNSLEKGPFGNRESLQYKYHIKTNWPPYDTFLFSYSFSLQFVIWILRLINSMIELINLMMQQFILGVILNMLFDLMLTRKLIILGILSKFNLSIKDLN